MSNNFSEPNNNFKSNKSGKVVNSKKSLDGLYAFFVIRDNTDINHTLSPQEIFDQIETKYNLKLGDRAKSRVLHTLEDGNMGICCEKGRYYMSNDNKDSRLIEELSEEELLAKFRQKNMNSNNSLAPVIIFAALENETNETKPMQQKKIIHILEKDYEINLGRAAVGRHLHTLEKYNVINSSKYGWYVA